MGLLPRGVWQAQKDPRLPVPAPQGKEKEGRWLPDELAERHWNSLAGYTHEALGVRLMALHPMTESTCLKPHITQQSEIFIRKSVGGEQQSITVITTN